MACTIVPWGTPTDDSKPKVYITTSLRFRPSSPGLYPREYIHLYRDDVLIRTFSAADFVATDVVAHQEPELAVGVYEYRLEQEYNGSIVYMSPTETLQIIEAVVGIEFSFTMLRDNPNPFPAGTLADSWDFNETDAEFLEDQADVHQVQDCYFRLRLANTGGTARTLRIHNVIFNESPEAAITSFWDHSVLVTGTGAVTNINTLAWSAGTPLTIPDAAMTNLPHYPDIADGNDDIRNLVRGLCLHGGAMYVNTFVDLTIDPDTVLEVFWRQRRNGYQDEGWYGPDTEYYTYLSLRHQLLDFGASISLEEDGTIIATAPLVYEPS